MYLFSIQDIKNDNRFSPPVAIPSVPDMQRSLMQMLRDNPKHLWAQFPEDYRLFRVGSFVIDTGEVFQAEKGPEFILNMTDLVKKEA